MRVINRATTSMLAALVFLPAACSRPTHREVDFAAEEAAIREVNARWLDAVQAHDAEGEAAVFTSDGVKYLPHLEPIIGPAAVEAFDSIFFANNPTVVRSWSTDEIHVARSGDFAIQTGDFRASGATPGGNEWEDWGRILTVWTKEDGQWRVGHAMVSSTMPVRGSQDFWEGNSQDSETR